MRHRLNTEFLRECSERNQLSQLLKLANADETSRLNFKDYFATIKKEIAGANQVAICDTDSVREVGVCDFQAGKLEAAELGIICKSLLIGYASVPADEKRSANELIPTLQFARTTASLANTLLAANLIISQGGVELKKIPVSMIVTDSAAMGPVGMVSDFELEHWDYIKGEEPVLISLYLPKVALDSSKRHFVSITLRGDVIAKY